MKSEVMQRAIKFHKIKSIISAFVEVFVQTKLKRKENVLGFLNFSTQKMRLIFAYSLPTIIGSSKD